MKSGGILKAIELQALISPLELIYPWIFSDVQATSYFPQYICS
jgi:hypothetical protein